MKVAVHGLGPVGQSNYMGTDCQILVPVLMRPCRYFPMQEEMAFRPPTSPRTRATVAMTSEGDGLEALRVRRSPHRYSNFCACPTCRTLLSCQPRSQL
jgi:hypothetical protein